MSSSVVVHVTHLISTPLHHTNAPLLPLPETISRLLLVLFDLGDKLGGAGVELSDVDTGTGGRLGIDVFGHDEICEGEEIGLSRKLLENEVWLGDSGRSVDRRWHCGGSDWMVGTWLSWRDRRPAGD